jgi:hypothetical protein
MKQQPTQSTRPPTYSPNSWISFTYHSALISHKHIQEHNLKIMFSAPNIIYNLLKTQEKKIEKIYIPT